MSATEERPTATEMIAVESIPTLGHDEAMVLAATEFDRVVALLRRGDQ